MWSDVFLPVATQRHHFLQRVGEHEEGDLGDAQLLHDGGVPRQTIAAGGPCHGVIATREKVLNAGVDLNGFQPVPFDELLANNIRFKKEHLK